MRIKFTLVVLAALGLSTGLWLMNSTEQVVAEYSSRNAQMNQAEFNGAYEIARLLKGNTITGEIEPEDAERMRKAVKDYLKANPNAKANNFTWKQMGPDNVGGRTRSMIVVDDNHWYAGAVSGGLFETFNGGNSWQKVPTEFRSIGSLAMTGNGDIYVGSGCEFEANGGFSAGGSMFLGEGLFRSSDGGETFELVDGTEPAFMSQSGDWNYVNALHEDPNNPNRVWIAADAGIGYYDSDTDELKMNQQAADGLTTASGHDIEISADGEVYLISQGAGKVAISHDGGQTFETLNGSGGLPNGMQRARVAVSDEDSNYCYAIFAASNGSMGGGWYSADGGNTWVEKWPGGVPILDPFGSLSSGRYNNSLCVDPNDPTRAICGGMHLWHFGVDVTPAQIADYGAFFINPSSAVHADIHEIVGTPDGRILICTDGGVYITEDGGSSYYGAKRGYVSSQFYGIGISSGSAVAGGMQDNGTALIPGDGSLNTLEEAYVVSGGDGFYTELSQATGGNNVVISTTQRGGFYRYDQDGSGGVFYDLNMQNQALNGEFEAGGFFTTIALFEDTEDEDSQQYTVVANTEDYDITDTTLTVFTNNLNIPFDYTLEEGDVLHFWEEIEREAIVTTEPLTEDPNYWWLDVQQLDSIVEICDIDSSFVETITVQIDSTAIVLCDTIYSEVLEMDIIVCDTTGYEPIMGDIDIYDYFEDCQDYYYYGADVVENVRESRRIIDPYTSMFVIGFTGDDGIWLTREALNFGVQPHWYRIVDNAPASGNGTKRFEFTQDGNHLFYCGWGAQLYRVDGLDSLWEAGYDTQGNESYVGGDVDSLVHGSVYNNAGGTITGMASDPNNPNHLVITIGGYGTANPGKVQETWNALDEEPTWENIWFPNSNELARMPIYDALIDVTDPTGATILVGTEFGVWTTDDGGNEWNKENGSAEPELYTGIDNAPTFELRQQKIIEPMQWREPINMGVIYAGTHGRGIFKTNDHEVVSVEEVDGGSAQSGQDLLLLYPNPVTNSAILEFNLDVAQDVEIKIYSVQGRLIETVTRGNLGAGLQQIELDMSALSNGNYLIQLDAGSSSGISRFMKM